ncbi:Partitioning defective 3-like protein B [Heterocephalus glaber]|uniref:Partitioning defective 3-like protein B n=1 Tax=Heterocephalus glaber TaxID=10181 RepID=G5BNT6_HETGA|nr:Partitioning defective 3-like protein B [Heterocephalus glaber]
MMLANKQWALNEYMLNECKAVEGFHGEKVIPLDAVPGPDTENSCQKKLTDPCSRHLYSCGGGRQRWVKDGRPAGGSTDRIQKLRKEYYQARREGFPLYEDDEGRTRPSDYDLHWTLLTSVQPYGLHGASSCLHAYFWLYAVWFGVLCEDQGPLLKTKWEMGGPADPLDYLTSAPRGLYKERELPYYPGAHPVHPPKGGYACPPDLRLTDLRYPQYYSPPAVPHHKGPFRHDVPPSPPQHQRVLAYQEMGRAGPRGGSPDRHPYRTQDPRQKNPMTAAV